MLRTTATRRRSRSAGRTTPARHFHRSPGWAASARCLLQRTGRPWRSAPTASRPRSRQPKGCQRCYAGSEPARRRCSPWSSAPGAARARSRGQKRKIRQALYPFCHSSPHAKTRKSSWHSSGSVLVSERGVQQVRCASTAEGAAPRCALTATLSPPTGRSAAACAAAQRADGGVAVFFIDRADGTVWSVNDGAVPSPGNASVCSPVSLSLSL